MQYSGEQGQIWALSSNISVRIIAWVLAFYDPMFKVPLLDLLAGSLWTSYLTFLNLDFLIGKLGIMMMMTSRDLKRIKAGHVSSANTVPGT